MKGGALPLPFAFIGQQGRGDDPPLPLRKNLTQILQSADFVFYIPAVR